MIWLFSIAIISLGIFVSLLGPIGMLMSILLSILLQSFTTIIGRTVKDAC